MSRVIDERVTVVAKDKSVGDELRAVPDSKSNFTDGFVGAGKIEVDVDVTVGVVGPSIEVVDLGLDVYAADAVDSQEREDPCEASDWNSSLV